jgi:hypothetical protein
MIKRVFWGRTGRGASVRRFLLVSITCCALCVSCGRSNGSDNLATAANRLADVETKVASQLDKSTAASEVAAALNRYAEAMEQLRAAAPVSGISKDELTPAAKEAFARLERQTEQRIILLDVVVPSARTKYSTSPSVITACRRIDEIAKLVLPGRQHQE